MKPADAIKPQRSTSQLLIKSMSKIIMNSYYYSSTTIIDNNKSSRSILVQVVIYHSKTKKIMTSTIKYKFLIRKNEKYQIVEISKKVQSELDLISTKLD